MGYRITDTWNTSVEVFFAFHLERFADSHGEYPLPPVSSPSQGRLNLLFIISVSV